MLGYGEGCPIDPSWGPERSVSVKMKAQEGNDTFQNGEENKTKRPVGDVLVFEELFVSLSGLDQQHVGGGGMMMSGRRGRHTPETVRLVLHARKKTRGVARD